MDKKVPANRNIHPPVEAGAQTATRNRFGLTPLDLARWWLSGSRTGPVPEALVQVLTPPGQASRVPVTRVAVSRLV